MNTFLNRDDAFLPSFPAASGSQRSPQSAKRPFSRHLLAHHLDDEPLGALAVELGIKNLLPGAEVEVTFGERQDHLVVDDDILEVGIAVGFAGLVMAVITVLRRE